MSAPPPQQPPAWEWGWGPHLGPRFAAGRGNLSAKPSGTGCSLAPLATQLSWASLSLDVCWSWWVDLGPNAIKALNSACFALQLPHRGGLAQVSGRRAPFCTQPARLPAAWPWSRGPSPGSTQGSSGQQCQVSAGTFPSLSPSCCSARALLKNLFHSSRHRGGNDGNCLRQHLSSQGWGAALALPTRSWGWDGVWELVSPGMEARAWERFCLPLSVSTLVHTSSPAPCPKAGLGCSALLHGVRGFLCHSSPCLGTLWSSQHRC